MDSSPSHTPGTLPLEDQILYVSCLLAYRSSPTGPPYTSSLKVVCHLPYPIPGPDEVCIRNRAVGLNHLDWKSLEHEVMIDVWPEILGREVAGVVEMVGSNVKEYEVMVGQAVVALTGPFDEKGVNSENWKQGLGVGRAGGFQDVTCVHKSRVARMPANWSFLRAAGVP